MPRKYSRVRRRSSKKATNQRPKSKKMLHSLTPKLTNATIRGAVRDYLNGGASKQRVVTQYGDISNWNVSNVTNMSEMFYRAESFNQPLKWNVSNVTDMKRMFHRAESFNQPLNNWNVSNRLDFFWS